MTPTMRCRKSSCAPGEGSISTSHEHRFEPGSTASRRTSASLCWRGVRVEARLHRWIERMADDFPSRQEGEPVHLQPYPDRLLDELTPAAPGPESTVEQRESVDLAFVAAVQMLPPRQRATLLLRDVIGYTTAEVAPMLETSVAGVNSALQRARATLARESKSGKVTRHHSPAATATERALVDRLVAAWHAADVPAIVALLTEDALFSMPPLPQYFVDGRRSLRSWSRDRRVVGSIASAWCRHARTVSRRWLPTGETQTKAHIMLTRSWSSPLKTRRSPPSHASATPLSSCALACR